ncbi:NAD(P)H-dependent oxidoreductase [Rhodococcus sp. G-MC3]|uniref:NADPH-dependent FMN reductase n=1 Tax=Rhodococcus sp. G-MC3 TaxID=3046209 RepID=UPI0024BBC520|nr:NAD(P)H-dependent oxidoreductase [Rhodococcus sp. G-MC3]MDJ0392734.1 NAD(P)H-dependent oxidoreductase [Rhodococcus sp. G-MC3]
MVADPVELAVVVASVRAERIGPVVADWIVRVTSERREFTVTTIDLLGYVLPADLSPSSGGTALAAAIGRADAVVVVTPEYNHGYPGSLKNALDSVKYEWRGKPIGFVSYGGLAGGIRATEQLRQVAAELHMVSVRDSVAVHRVRRAFDGQGNTADGAIVDSAGRMLDQLHWWATAARSLQDVRPYPGQ